jgi:hypothetical protein
MISVFGLMTKGFMINFDREQSLYSKKLFRTKADALAYTPEFLQKCTDTSNMFNLRSSPPPSVIIITYELED